ncbi:MAG: hypothetical protein KAH18_09435 [Psychromonas sp.]|nr:hypothetical protein [Psychromonas sp.]
MSEKISVTNNITQKVALPNAYKIKINMTDAVVIPKNDYLFVFASQVGVAMPVAVIKMKIPSFPISLTLSDANTMMKGTQLSDYPKLIIKASISSSGDVDQTQG